jgi:hypothetical protein
MKIFHACSIVFRWNRRGKRVYQEMHCFFLHGIARSYFVFLFPQGSRYNMNVIMATITKIITSYFAIAIGETGIYREQYKKLTCCCKI